MELTSPGSTDALCLLVRLNVTVNHLNHKCIGCISNEKCKVQRKQVRAEQCVHKQQLMRWNLWMPQ